MSLKTLPAFTEFECKYLTSLDMLHKFKTIARNLPGLLNFITAEGPDYFYTSNSPNTFLRFRRGGYSEKDGKYYQQLTTKTKTPNAKNSIQRKEPNLIVTASVEEVQAFINSVGFKFSHSIYKVCHIYTYQDTTLVFYSVSSGDSEQEHYVEIEVNEDTIHTLTENQAWAVIEKYEALLAPTGISARKRLKLSLMERYKP